MRSSKDIAKENKKLKARLAEHEKGARWNISERKAAENILRKNEEELRKLNRTLTAHSRSDQAMMRAANEEEYLDAVCNVIIRDCGYLMVWIGFAEQNEAKTVRAAAQAGFEKGYLKTVDITWADTARGRGPTGTAIRTGKTCICRNMLTDPDFKPWRREAKKRGYMSSIVLPLTANNLTLGAISIYSKEPDPFSEKEVRLLSELADDLAFGITAMRLRAERAEAEAVLKRDKETFERLVHERTKQLVEAQMELERTKRLSDIGTLAATVAHELRNPLAAIAIAGHNIKRKAKNPDLDKHLVTIDKKVNESDQIINNLLFYSRLKPPQHEAVNIFEIIKECAENVEKKGTKAVRIARSLDGIRGIIIKADPIQMREVFNNILNNAYDAVLQEKGLIRISVENEEKFIRVIVEDNGGGIDKSFIDRVFDPFFTTKAKGTGLGLSVCRQIVAMHEGEIGIKSGSDKGTSVMVRLPKKI